MEWQHLFKQLLDISPEVQRLSCNRVMQSNDHVFRDKNVFCCWFRFKCLENMIGRLTAFSHKISAVLSFTFCFVFYPFYNRRCLIGCLTGGLHAIHASQVLVRRFCLNREQNSKQPCCARYEVIMLSYVSLLYRNANRGAGWHCFSCDYDRSIVVLHYCYYRRWIESKINLDRHSTNAFFCLVFYSLYSIYKYSHEWILVLNIRVNRLLVECSWSIGRCI